MKGKRIAIISVLLGITLVVFGVNAQPRGGPPRGHGPMAPGAQRGMRGPENPIEACIDLGLSESQINQLIDLQAAFMKKQIPMLRRMNELGGQLREERKISDPNTDRVRSLMDEMGKIRTDLAVARLESRKNALTILTSEQRDLLGKRPVPFLGGPMGAGGPMGHEPPAPPDALGTPPPPGHDQMPGK